VGKVGNDDAGTQLLCEMENAGLDLRFVKCVTGRPTLYSFCFLYPDGSGGNLTTEDSACGLVDPALISATEGVCADLGAAGIALAVPEVPLVARTTLLALATRYGLFRAASFARGEIRMARESGILDSVDLLAINLEEAAAAAGLVAIEESKTELARRAFEILCNNHPRLTLSLTAGTAGSWAGDARELFYEPALSVKVEGTAGAGDAHFAGLLAGLCAGLDIPAALQLATLVAAASLSSGHTINPDIARALQSLAKDRNVRISPNVRALFDSPQG
jgi:sugar/nucleoside kinase (ribokinase family)